MWLLLAHPLLHGPRFSSRIQPLLSCQHQALYMLLPAADCDRMQLCSPLKGTC
jgi:hypothetical protein